MRLIPQKPRRARRGLAPCFPNTQAEKAAFIEAAFAELQRQLGYGAPLEEASYVIVRELPASDWGYGGHTQQARQLARRRTVAA